MRHSPNSRSGSAFFLILLAIAMFAGLSYAVMRGSRTSAANLTSEQARVAASEIIAYASAMQKTVQTMRLRGVTETEFDFANSVFTLGDKTTPMSYSNATCTSSACKVFDINGGRLVPIPAPSYAMMPVPNPTWWHPGHAGARVIRIEGIGTSAPDLTMFMYYLKPDVCKKINDIVGVTNPSGNPPVDDPENATTYNATITTFPAPAGYGFGNQSTALVGKSMFCATSGSSSFFVAVLLAR